MAATPKQIAANRANAQKSTGPRTEEGKEIARRNALKHGLTGRGVVIPGEDEHEVANRIALLEDQLAPDGDVVAALLVRQVAIASIRVERAFRHETALAAERMRRAGDVFDDDRRSTAEAIMGDLPIDPTTCRRRLLMAPEGVDAIIKRLTELATRTEPKTFVAWDVAEGEDLDRCLGWRPERAVKSRVGLLTQGIVYDHWEGLDPADYAELTPEGRILWAVGELRAIIAAEVADLEVHRAALDPARVERSRAEASERALLDLDKEGTALRRYAGAAERAMLKMFKELRIVRYEAQCRALEPAEAKEALDLMVAEMPALKEVRAELASFCPAPGPRLRPGPRSIVGSTLADLGTSFVPINIGKAPLKPVPPRP